MGQFLIASFLFYLVICGLMFRTWFPKWQYWPLGLGLLLMNYFLFIRLSLDLAIGSLLIMASLSAFLDQRSLRIGAMLNAWAIVFGVWLAAYWLDIGIFSLLGYMAALVIILWDLRDNPPA